MLPVFQAPELPEHHAATRARMRAGFEVIPHALRGLACWFVAGDTKQPRLVTSPAYPGNTARLVGAGTFAEAVAAFHKYPIVNDLNAAGHFHYVLGVGVVTQEHEGILSIDFDSYKGDQNTEHAREFYRIQNETLRRLYRAGAYIERSMSGKGWHAYMHGRLPRGEASYRAAHPHCGIEFFAHGQFIVVTGDRTGLPPWQPDSPLPNSQTFVDGMMDQFIRDFGKGASLEALDANAGPTTAHDRRMDMTDDEVVAKLCTSALSKAWYNGEKWKPNEDWSGTTYFLLGELDKITGDPDQVHRILMRSPRLCRAGTSIKGEDRAARTSRIFRQEFAKSRASNNAHMPGVLERREHGRMMAAALGIQPI
jgi:primase-polymerase (primpol)-like protein